MLCDKYRFIAIAATFRYVSRARGARPSAALLEDDGDVRIGRRTALDEHRL